MCRSSAVQRACGSHAVDATAGVAGLEFSENDLSSVKGIRVNQLAKELGVESKAILAKCREEGLGDKVPNHMSTLSLGLAQSVREWFSGGGGGVATAVETARSVAVLTKPKLAQKSVGKAVDADEDGDAPPSSAAKVAADAPVPQQPATSYAITPTFTPAPVRAPVAAAAESSAVIAVTIPTEGPSTDSTPAAAPQTGTLASAPSADAAPPQAVPPPVATAAPASAAPTPAAPPAAAVKAPATPVRPPSAMASGLSRPTTGTPPVGGPPQAAPTSLMPGARAAANLAANPNGLPGGERPLRPTVTLQSMPGAAPTNVVRKPIVPVAFVPKPAVIVGPTVVRVEKPDHVAPLRGRLGPPGSRPTGPGRGGPNDIAAFQQARPVTGGGVVRTDDEEEQKKAAAAKKSSLSTRRKGLDGRRGEASEKLKEFTEADLIIRKDALNAAAANRATVDRHLRQVTGRGQHTIAKTTLQRGEPVEIEEPITLRTLATALGVKANDVLRKIMRSDRNANINMSLAADAAETLALEFGIELLVRQPKTAEEELLAEFEARVVNAEDLLPRAPVVTILGHVDHGKTSLLDRIRNANVAAGEAGGITQHTAAWMVSLGEGEAAKRVTFIDTPGHQAFTSMRARGANMTDVVVLVVSAAEGVQPQTVESINHAKAAGVPIVVAMNKIDRADANPDMVLGQLAAQGLNPAEWGGDIEVVRTSATTGQGVSDLIEILDYQSTLLELKADPTAPARGTVIEASIDEGLGSVATVLVQNGTLRPGDIILTGPGYGRVRSLWNDRGENIDEAGPSVPVIVSGLDESPQAGDKLFELDDLDRARSIAEERAVQTRHTYLSSATRVTLDNLFDTMKAGEIKTINLIIKADVQGSVETLAATVTGQNTEEVRVKVLHAAVGGITESDVELADASKAVIIGFNVVPDTAARNMAEQRRVEIRQYSVIYEIFDDLKKALSGMLEPEIREKLHGHAEVRKVFRHSKIGSIAGCYVTDGHIQRGSKVRLTRAGIVVTEDLSIETLKRVKDDVKEVKTGFECGIKLAGYDDVKEGDILEAYIKETIQRTL